MKKVIDGSLYDTDKASMLGSGGNGRPPTDLDYIQETLYRTRAGKYFLHGVGGPNTRYGEWLGNHGTGGEKLMPLTATEASEWAQKNLDADTYVKVFDEPSESDKIMKCISLTPAASKRLEQLKVERGSTLSAVVEELIMGVEC